ncbi:MAG: sulfatase-like hydrolase/transferase, partial [Thermoguttaceae bacterium]
MFKLKTTVAASIALAMIGGIIACSSQLAKSGGDSKNSSSPSASNKTTPATTSPLPSAKELAKADDPAPAAEPATSGKKPNIVVIMSDDVGIWNIGAYSHGMMAGKTPHLDRLAKQGMLFTDYYAEASCTAGRANFITGELPVRTGMTTVGQAGAKIGIPAEACTIATALKPL